MAENMQKQKEEARKQAAQQKVTETDEKPQTKPTPTSRRQTRNGANQESSAEDGNTEVTTSGPKKRGRPKKGGAPNNIANYFQKTNVEVPKNNPTVNQALQKAAEEFEEKPTVLGEQDLVATQQPKLVSGGQMRKYQLEGLEWLKTLWMNGLCGILADEMGLGKTVQCISMIAYMKENKVSGPFLVVAPVSTLSNWVDEFARWTPSVKTVLYHGNPKERESIRQKHMKQDSQRDMDFPVVCTSYELCMNDRKYLGQYQWRYIIVVCS